MLSLAINPVIFRIGFVQVTYYALVYIFGILVALAVLLRASRKKEIDMSEGEVYDFLILCALGLLVGARAFHALFWDLNYFLANPVKIFYIWEGGLSFHGGLVGAAVASFLYSRHKKLSWLKIADVLVIPIVFILALGRIANFINQEIVGTITNVSWCFNFEYSEGCRHPVQLYAALGRFALFFFLLTIKKKLRGFKEKFAKIRNFSNFSKKNSKNRFFDTFSSCELKSLQTAPQKMNYSKFSKDGFIFWSFVFSIGLGRFFLDFLREDIRYLGLASGQWLALVMVILGFYILIKNYKQDLSRVTKISRLDVGDVGSTELPNFHKTS